MSGARKAERSASSAKASILGRQPCLAAAAEDTAIGPLLWRLSLNMNCDGGANVRWFGRGRSKAPFCPKVEMASGRTCRTISMGVLRDCRSACRGTGLTTWDGGAATGATACGGGATSCSAAGAGAKKSELAGRATGWAEASSLAVGDQVSTLGLTDAAACGQSKSRNQGQAGKETRGPERARLAQRPRLTATWHAPPPLSLYGREVVRP